MLHELAVAQPTKMLLNLRAILATAVKHAADKSFDPDVLANSRLAPDQFNLLRQVQIACDAAKLGAARLAGKEASAPAHPDIERTLAELDARLASVIDYLDSLAPEDFKGAAERRITQPRWNGKTLSGAEFLVQHAIPNFYFHVTTAYSILRHNGVEIGKRDYLGAMPFQE